MERVTIAAELRTGTGKSVTRKLRAAGKIPAVAYGKHVETPLNLTISTNAMSTILRKGTGRFMPLDITLGEKTLPAIVREVQVDAISRMLKHIDFLLVEANTPVKVEVPIRTEGKSKGEAAGARLIKARREVLIRALPANIPEEIVVDVTRLVGGEVLYIDQLTLPEGVEAVFRTRYPVIVLMKAKVAEELDGDAPEGDPEEDDAEGEAAE
jgi:large subunit ribosomal protein L25